MKKVLIVVPAFNEATMIKSVVKDLVGNGYKNILVVDDGSGDNTFESARSQNVLVVRHIINRGLGAGLGTGFEYALRNDYDILVTFDADGQHQAKDISRLIDKLNEGYDVVVGSRALDHANMPLIRRVLNWASNFLTFIMTGVWTTDSLSGLRVFNKTAIDKILIKTDRMEVSNEFFKEIGRNNLKLSEVPIKAIYTEYSLANSKQEKFASLKIALKLVFRLFR